MKAFVLSIISFISVSSIAQTHYWQQEALYKMEIDFDAQMHQFKGTQELVYTNNSPDTLTSVFYHLYFNAFQKGSMMDVRSRNIEDPDRRVGDRIYSLTKDEEGYQKINALSQNGKDLAYHVEGTVLEVKLIEPILPNSKTTLKMNFEAQVPKQIRRSGRDNAEGIAYSMTQWYPKMAEYDYEGWHANPYIGREFHGVWGTFDVKIKMDSAYTIAGTGYLQNKEEIGKGYAKNGSQKSAKLEWHFKTPRVHDFAWAADKKYKHITHQVNGGPLLRFFYVPSEKTVLWDSLPKYTALIFQKMNEKFGVYPYDEYAVIQGGDGGMEYAMATLITGHRSKGSLIGVTAHEAIHSWYQHVLATNESFYSWMDEGFTSYAEDVILAEILPGFKPFEGSYRSYYSLVSSGKQMPLSTHADWFHTNRAYGVASYSMGCIFLHQLSYVIGQEALNKGMLTYYNEWKFKHPTPTDFKRIMEKESGMELDWYFDQWLKSTNTIDYAIQSTYSQKNKTTITIERKGEMPMPLDIEVKLKSGKAMKYYIPLSIMRAEKAENKSAVLLKDWPWTYPTYEFSIDIPQFEIESIEIDPTKRMADIDQSNNVFPRSKESTFIGN
ncbi:M1 family metallopeptidase [Acidiluteibacter ferrifornacis]|uniref:M1 family peptidase n=1 Tax=Acidiluteibacter ferrifornacis TaxID=2692424 RepID=A0A6N9NM76_9FLAO|nr:M1 family metallopeptidase [Acidiluteibacter ferrifornacis]NBG66994.1 M1 family peptidase [Acidiluteibacter ferrifornacis]